MKKMDKQKLWTLLNDYLIDNQMAIDGEIDDLKDGLFEDFLYAKKAYPSMSTEDFLEAFMDELLCYPIQVSDKVIVPKGI